MKICLKKMADKNYTSELNKRCEQEKLLITNELFHVSFSICPEC